MRATMGPEMSTPTTIDGRKWMPRACEGAYCMGARMSPPARPAHTAKSRPPAAENLEERFEKCCGFHDQENIIRGPAHTAKWRPPAVE
jgi:hypothetical protein